MKTIIRLCAVTLAIGLSVPQAANAQSITCGDTYVVQSGDTIGAGYRLRVCCLWEAEPDGQRDG
ncbi:MAG: hypothetical protein AAFY59_03930, partial [Pseudomonadota bacterium]